VLPLLLLVSNLLLLQLPLALLLSLSALWFPTLPLAWLLLWLLLQTLLEAELRSLL
jgi:hypothetical protein